MPAQCVPHGACPVHGRPLNFAGGCRVCLEVGGVFCSHVVALACVSDGHSSAACRIRTDALGKDSVSHRLVAVPSWGPGGGDCCSHWQFIGPYVVFVPKDGPPSCSFHPTFTLSRNAS